MRPPRRPARYRVSGPGTRWPAPAGLVGPAGDGCGPRRR